MTVFKQINHRRGPEHAEISAGSSTIGCGINQDQRLVANEVLNDMECDSRLLPVEYQGELAVGTGRCLTEASSACC